MSLHTSSVGALLSNPLYRPHNTGTRCAFNCQNGTRGKTRRKGEMSEASRERWLTDAGGDVYTTDVDAGVDTGMMIARRRLKRDERNATYAELKEWRSMLREESDFEAKLLAKVRGGREGSKEPGAGFGLAKSASHTFNPVFLNHLLDWGEPSFRSTTMQRVVCVQ